LGYKALASYGPADYGETFDQPFAALSPALWLTAMSRDATSDLRGRSGRHNLSNHSEKLVHRTTRDRRDRIQYTMLALKLKKQYMKREGIAIIETTNIEILN
jgi:hypothetical protein